MVKLFGKYASVGVINTALHWAVFFILHISGLNQTVSNTFAFIAAVIFSFFVNARFTFKGEANLHRFILYTFFMGLMAALVGKTADLMHLPSLFTLIAFSSISLIIGFLWSKFIVFREIK